MSRFIVQARVIELPGPGAEPDEWSSARSTMTVFEVSTPFDAGSADEAVAAAGDVLRTYLSRRWPG